MPQNNWTRNELILAFNLYCKTPFGRIHNRNPEIITLASLIGRTPNAVGLKMVNFAHLDPVHKARGISGMAHGGKGDLAVWNEFNNDWERLAFESEKLWAERLGTPLQSAFFDDDLEIIPQGKEREAIVKVRVNQSFFRATVLSAYGFRCCISGLAVPELLNASHIVPWAKDAANRVNPRNGLCLNALLDRAYDRGLLTITPEYIIKVSKIIKDFPLQTSLNEWILAFDEKPMFLPTRFAPDPTLLSYHNEQIFRGL